MSLRLKTCQYAFPVLASLTNNSLTNLTQITVYLPETTKTIKKAWVEVSMDDIITATGGSLTTKTINLRLGAASYSSSTNSITAAHSGENASWFFERDFTQHFINNWSGTSMTCDVQVQMNQSTGTTTGMVNVCCILNITYEYDDEATTQLKTVWIPLNGPTTELPTSKTSHDTIPELDTYLPENSKTYRNVFIVTQSNINAVDANDCTITYELSSLGTHTTGNYESALLTDRWTRYVWDITSYITTNTTHTFNVWCSIARRHHCLQAWLVVTYEFDSYDTTSVLNSLFMPTSFVGPMGGTTSNDYSRGVTEFYIEEENITFNKLAAYYSWMINGNMVGLNARIGSGIYTSFTNTGSAVLAGFRSLMIRNDNPTGISISRGKNKLFFDAYNTSTTLRGTTNSLLWIINYTSDKHPSGVGVHNHTVFWPIYLQDSSASVHQLIINTGAIQIPDTGYFISNIGYKIDITSLSANSNGISAKVERTSGEGLYNFEDLYSEPSIGGGETCSYHIYTDDKKLFQRWSGDVAENNLVLNSGRRYVLYSCNNSVFYNSLTQYVTYHSIPFTVSGNIINSNGSNIQLSLHRDSDGKKLLTTSRSGNGPYNFTWFDNTEPVFVSAYENSGYKGRSASSLAI